MQLQEENISETTAIKKAKEEVYKSEKEKLITIEWQHKTTGDPTLLLGIKVIRDNIDRILTTEIEFFLKQSYYEVGPRATKLLAKRIKKQQADRPIHKIRDISTNQIIYEPKEIEKKFMNNNNNIQRLV